MLKINNPPTPKILINSIRQIGYSFESAVADIIDNSLSANAKNIDIYMPVGSNQIPYIAFLDDGVGMDRDTAINALKIGSNFEGERQQQDLGRFGLGLKSASFSQCRKVSVISKKDNQVVALGWDIDEVESSNEWNCFEYFDSDIQNIPKSSSLYDLRSGTLVVWQNFDLIQAKLDENTNLQRQLSNLLEQAREHIALVFHRYINNKTKIAINNEPIEGLNPFLENHLKTEKGKVSSIAISNYNQKECVIKIQAYTMPHYHDLDDSDRALLGGADKMRERQGFYIYRNDRLIVYGTWFRIRVKSEIAKYAKIKVDIPNSLDDIWEIDIKKQKATIPQKLMVHFKKTIDDIRARSQQKVTHKKIDIGRDNKRIWNKQVGREGKETYFVNLDSSFVREFVEQHFEDISKPKIYQLLEIVGSAIPFDDIYNSVCNQSIGLDVDADREQLIVDQAIDMIKRTQNTNKSSIEQAATIILSFEPFDTQNIVKKVKEVLGLS